MPSHSMNPLKRVDPPSDGVDNVRACTIKASAFLSQSQHITPCLKSDNRELATSKYISTAPGPDSFPSLLHPVNGQVSNSAKHRVYTDYLRKSGFLKTLGKCVLDMYQNENRPDPEKLLEELLLALGYEPPDRKKISKLTNKKESLQLTLEGLLQERNSLLESLDEFEDSAAKYELLDQDEVLPPKPDNSPVNTEMLKDVFASIVMEVESEDKQTSDLLYFHKKDGPMTHNVLPIPYHDIRLVK